MERFYEGPSWSTSVTTRGPCSFMHNGDVWDWKPYCAGTSVPLTIISIVGQSMDWSGKGRGVKLIQIWKGKAYSKNTKTYCQGHIAHPSVFMTTRQEITQPPRETGAWRIEELLYLAWRSQRSAAPCMGTLQEGWPLAWIGKAGKLDEMVGSLTERCTRRQTFRSDVSDARVEVSVSNAG